jgi:BioD-like phosphotransacetylase family protein
VAVLQIVGNQSGAGKTSLASALLVTANNSGEKVAYYKPFADGRTADLDAVFMSALSVSLGSPAVPPPANKSDSGNLSFVQSEISKLEPEASIVILECPDSRPYAIESKVALIYQGSLEALPEAVTTAGPSLSAVIINSVPIHRRDEVARGISLRSLPAVVLPESRSMLAITVEQLANHLGGQWVLDPVNINAPVERIMIGGNIMDGGPTYFDRYPNQAVITRVERPDIQMASMCDKTACIVLTGPGEPTEYIKAEALKRGVPLIQVRTNTHETAEALNGLIDRADARTNAKAHHFAGLVAKYSAAKYLDHLLS